MEIDNYQFMNRRPNLSKRISRPHTMASAVGGLLKIFGRTASDADLVARWDEIMGEGIAKTAKLSGISPVPPRVRGGGRKAAGGAKFNIAVRATNPARALELSYMKDEITNKINKYFGFDAVNKITIRK